MDLCAISWGIRDGSRSRSPDRSVKILQIHTRYRSPGGEDAVVEDEHELLERRGHHVRQISFSNPRTRSESVARLITAPWNRRALQRVNSAVEDFAPDVMHVHNTWFEATPAIFHTTPRPPTVLTLHNYRLICANALLYRSGGPCTDCVGRGPWRGVAHRCYRSSVVSSASAAATITINRAVGTWAHVDRFIAMTEFARDMHVRGGVEASRISVRPSFAEDPGIRDEPPSASDYVLYAGRLSQEKGLDVALQAWRMAQQHDLRMVVAGEGPERARLESLGEGSVEFMGHVNRSELTALMKDARALILPSRCFEGQPRVLLEAMASGIPIIASSIGGLEETLGGGRAGRLVRPDHVRSWTEVFRSLDEGSWIDEMGLSGRALYEERHTPARAAETLEAVYVEAVAESHGR